jgi:hypothetical protein
MRYETEYFLSEWYILIEWIEIVLFVSEIRKQKYTIPYDGH